VFTEGGIEGIDRLRDTRMRARAFSLVEMVIVVVIVGVVAAIAVPRVTTASRQAKVNALEATMANIRQAMELYYADHGRYPGYNPGTGAPLNANFPLQLTLYTDEAGNTSTTFGTPFIYGPYLREPFPANPINGLSNVYVKATPASPSLIGGTGWLAVLSTGDFEPNVSTAELEEFTIETAKAKP
jgi:general secretion pathway protein G